MYVIIYVQLVKITFLILGHLLGDLLYGYRPSPSQERISKKFFVGHILTLIREKSLDLDSRTNVRKVPKTCPGQAHVVLTLAYLP